MTNAIADALRTHGEAVRRASGFVLVAKGRLIRLDGKAGAPLIATTPSGEIWPLSRAIVSNARFSSSWTGAARFRLAKNNRSKSACTLNQRKRLNNQAVWPVILRLTGPICARAPNL